MNLNRRNTIIGLGTIVAGGGAALGSGAFSTAEAERGLEVNVVTDENIAVEFVDIVLKDVTSRDRVDVGDEETDIFDADNLSGSFPESDDAYGTYGADENDISLMQNNVTIKFGDEDSFLANSTTTFEDLLVLVNEGGEGSNGQVNVEFSTDDDVDSEFTFTDGNGKNFSDGDTVDEDESIEVDLELATGSIEEDNGTLTIEISDPDT